MRLRPPIPGFLECGIYKESPYYPTRLGFPRPESATKRSLDLLMAEMDTAGVAVGVVMGRNGSQLGSVSNREIAEFVEGNPRFVWFAGLDVADVPSALDEMRTLSGAEGLKGYAIEPGLAVPPIKADDPSLDPIYEACAAAGSVISISLSPMMGPDLSYSDPVAVQHVARRFPELRIVVSHAAWPWVHQMLGVAFACPNVYVSPDLYMNAIDMPGARDFARAANLFLDTRLLYGSAYPSRPIVESVAAFRDLPIDPGVKERVLFTNACELLDLTPPASREP